MGRTVAALAAALVAAGAPARASDGADPADPSAGTGGKAAAPPGPKDPARLATAEFLYRCLHTFGHPGFCGCVAARRPEGVDFDAFVLFTSRSRTELGYEQLGEEERKLVDATRAARSACVEREGWQ